MSASRGVTGKVVASTDIEAIVDDGGDIKVGQVGGECVAAVSNNYNYPAMLVRRGGIAITGLHSYN
jgi:hypothetical protein